MNVEQDLATQVVLQAGGGLTDAMGSLNVPVVEALLNYNRIPEEMRSSLFRHILIICDELGRPNKDGKQDPTHH